MRERLKRLIISMIVWIILISGFLAFAIFYPCDFSRIYHSNIVCGEVALVDGSNAPFNFDTSQLDFARLLYVGDREYAVCFDAVILDDSLIVSDVSSPVFGDSTSVVLSCNSSGSIHSHPGGSCEPSRTDIDAYSELYFSGQKYFIVQCSSDEVAVFVNDGSLRGYVYEI